MNKFNAEWTNNDALSVGWKSQIDTYTEEVQTAFDGEVLKAVQRVGIIVDRDELLKALAYDRGQYKKGYEDGKKARDAEIVRCKDCKFYRSWGRANICECWTADPYEAAEPEENDFCSFAERRDDGLN